MEVFFVVFVLAVVAGLTMGSLKMESSIFQSLVRFCIIFLLILQTGYFYFCSVRFNSLRKQLQNLEEKMEKKGKKEK